MPEKQTLSYLIYSKWYKGRGLFYSTPEHVVHSEFPSTTQMVFQCTQNIWTKWFEKEGIMSITFQIIHALTNSTRYVLQYIHWCFFFFFFWAFVFGACITLMLINMSCFPKLNEHYYPFSGFEKVFCVKQILRLWPWQSLV